jgi:hypothetical protein
MPDAPLGARGAPSERRHRRGQHEQAGQDDDHREQQKAHKVQFVKRRIRK